MAEDSQIDSNCGAEDSKADSKKSAVLRTQKPKLF